MNNKIVLLGPFGSTFSGIAAQILTKRFGGPEIKRDGSNCVLVDNNADVIETAIIQNAWAILAVETKSNGWVGPSVVSMTKLLGQYKRSSLCDRKIIGAIQLHTHFALMGWDEKRPEKINEIIAHQTSFITCRAKLNSMAYIGAQRIEVSSNGKAAEIVKEKRQSGCVALAPLVAAEKLGLFVYERDFQEENARTKIILLGPKNHPFQSADDYGFLTVFELQSRPGAILRAIKPFADKGININHYSVPIGEEKCRFVLEGEISGDKLDSLQMALFSASARHMTKSLFGIFPLIYK